MNNLTRDLLLSVLPDPLKSDTHMLELATTAADALVDAWERTTLPRIFSNLDGAPEWVLDVLAKDLNVILYDKTYSIEVKRALLRDAMYTHRHLGTPSAIERAIADIWADVKLEEWFEYGGDPYHFRLTVYGDDTDEDEATTELIIKKTKNVRSILDSITYNGITSSSTVKTGSVISWHSVSLTSANMEEDE